MRYTLQITSHQNGKYSAELRVYFPDGDFTYIKNDMDNVVEAIDYSMALIREQGLEV